MIGIKTAAFLFGLLFAISFFALRGPARYISFVIVGGLAAKAVVHYYRSRME